MKPRSGRRKTAEPGRPRRGARAVPGRWGWALLSFVLLVLLAAVGADAFLTRPPHPGFRQPDAYGALYCRDLPGFLRATRHVLDQHGEASSQAHAAVQLLPPLPFAPKPIRIRFWLGRQVLATVSPEGTVFCLKPGLPFRLAYAMSAAPQDGSGLRGITLIHGWSCAWRDGFLLASRHPAALKQTLQAGEAAAPYRAAAGHPAALYVDLGADAAFQARVDPEPGLPLSGSVRTGPLPQGRSRTLAPIKRWPERLWLQLEAADTRVLIAVLAAFRDSLHGVPRIEAHIEAANTMLARWQLDFTRVTWPPHDGPFALALGMYAPGYGPLLPEALAIWRAPAGYLGGHPLAPVMRQLHQSPYEWRGQPGQVATLQGGALALCLAQLGRDYYAASREPLMAAALGNLERDAAAPGDLLLTLHPAAGADSLHSAGLWPAPANTGVLLRTLEPVTFVGVHTEDSLRLRGRLLPSARGQNGAPSGAVDEAR